MRNNKRVLRGARARSLIALLVALALLGTGLNDASADLSPNGDASAWVTDDRVYAITQVGDTIYVGGQFSGVAPNGSAPLTSRPFIAAFEADSGDYIPGFNPTLNGTVRSLASSADGTRLYVGGEFTSVNGESRNAIVSLDPTTGATDANFAVTANASTMYDIEVDGDVVYLAGNFTNLNGVANASRAARVNAHSGRVDGSWKPRPSAQVEAISIPPNGNRIYLGGRFDTLAGVRADNLAAVRVDNAALIEHYQAADVAGCGTYQPNGIRSIDATNSRIFAMPYNNNCIMVFEPGRYSRVREYNMDGDVQVAYLYGDRFFVGGHSAVVGNFAQNRMYAFDLNGNFDPSMTTDAGGQPGVFAYYGSGSNLWVGGTIFTIGSTNSIKDLGRVGPAPGESIPSTPGGLSSTIGGGGATLSWQGSSDPNGIAGYRVLRGNEQLAFVTGTSYTDVRYRDGEVNLYHVEAVDNRHNLSERSEGLLVGLDGVEVSPIADRASAVGDVINLPVTAVGANPITFSAQGLPDGLNMASNGRITGITTTIGSYNPTITATNGIDTGSITFRWVVVNDSIGVGPTPQAEFSTPIPGVVQTGGDLSITGVASDNSGVGAVRISVLNVDTGQYLQSNLSFGNGFNRVASSLQAPGSTVSTFSLALSGLPSAEYRINALPVGVDGGDGPTIELEMNIVDTLANGPFAAIQFPESRTNVYGAFSIIGTASDDIGIDRVEVLVKEKFPTNSGRRLQDNFTLASAYNTFDAELSAPGSPVTRFWLDLPANLPNVNPWQIRIIVTDNDGNRFSETLVNGFGIDGEYYAGRNAPTPYPVPDFDQNTGPQAPTVTLSGPPRTVTSPNPVQISGSATDNTAIDAISVRLRNDIGWYLQPGGGFSSAQADLAATVTGLGTTSATYSVNAGTLALGSYSVEVVATDSSTLTATATRNVTVQAPSGPADDIIIGAGIQGNEYNISAGSQLTPTRNILLDRSQFGPNGVYAVDSIAIVEDVANMSQGYVDQLDILFNGWTGDGEWSTGELDVVENWVRAGGVLVATNDGVDFDALGRRFGNPILAAGDGTWSSVGSSHPIINGPFGTWNTIFGATSQFGYFADTPGWTVVSRNSSNQPTIVTREFGSGYVILTADEGIFRNNIPGQNATMAGNLFAHAIDFLGGGQPDVPTINNVADQTNTVGESVNLQLVASPAGQVTFSENGLPSGLSLNTNTGVISGVVDSDEVASVTVTATNNAGVPVSTSFTWTVELVPDAIDPDTVIDSPLGGDDLLTGTVTISGTATDDATGVDRVQVAIRDFNSQLWLQADGTFATTVYRADAVLDAPGTNDTGWTFEVDLPAGRYVAVPRAFDGFGNVEFDRPRVNFFVADPVFDIDEPDSAVTTPAHLDDVAAGAVTLSGTATDTGIGVARVRFSLRDRDSLLYLQENGTWAFDFDLVDAVLTNPLGNATNWSYDVMLPAGRYAMTTRAVDAADNTESTRPFVPFTVS